MGVGGKEPKRCVWLYNEEKWVGARFSITYFIIVSFYHVRYTFRKGYTFCDCLNVKELLAQNRRDI